VSSGTGPPSDLPGTSPDAAGVSSCDGLFFRNQLNTKAFFFSVV
jgi:hypothetical protein